MQILTVDVGTGTQDVLLFDSERALENCFKLVLPSPTVIVADRIRAATSAGARLALSGTTMGGGPCHWAAMDHVRAGLEVFATSDAARTFDDDLDAVREMGIAIVSADEVAPLVRGGAVGIDMRDVWLPQILAALSVFDVRPRLDAMAVAVFDHGAAPPGYSDRIFRFDYLRDRLSKGVGLAGFAFERDAIPTSMTRLRAAADSAPADLRVLAMDTAPAAVLGALEDERVRERDTAVVANVGNFHCLAFHVSGGAVAGLFEHHTGELSAAGLRRYVEQLADSSIDNATVYADKGHGALVLDEQAPAPEFFAVTGPRRQLLIDSGMQVYRAVPHGDMMLTGNFGLLRAFAAADDTIRDAVVARMGPA